MSAINVARFLYTRSLIDYRVTGITAGSGTIYNGGIDLSINDSQQVDYSLRNINIKAGLGTGQSEENTIHFDISKIIDSYFDRPQFISRTLADLSSGNNEMPPSVYKLMQFDLWQNGAQVYNNIGDTIYNVAFRGAIKQTFSNTNILTPDVFLQNILLEDNYKASYYVDDFTAQNIYLNTPTGNGTFTVTWTNLKTNATQVATLLPDRLQQVPSVHPLYAADGNKVVISNGTYSHTSYYYPISECKYEVVKCNYIGAYGVPKVIWFFKASTDKLSVTDETYNEYYQQEDKVTTLCVNGRQSFKVNTGWVEEWFNIDLRQLLLSENIQLVTNSGIISGDVTLKTKEVDMVKKINTKLINYTLEFENTNTVI